MPVFTVRNANGSVVLDLSRRISKVLGRYTTTPGVAGSIGVPITDGGNVWFSAVPSGQIARYTALTISLNGSVISWNPGGVPYIITYGVY